MFARRGLLVRIALVCGVVGGVLLSPVSANAHAVLESTVPAASSVVKTSPTFIQLDFNENVEKNLASIRLFDQDRNEVVVGAAKRSGTDASVLRAEDVPLLKDGMYVVVWRAISADGHPVTGAFPFQVGAGGSLNSNLLLEKILAGLSTKSDLGFALGVGKFLAYLGALVLVGCATFAWGSRLAENARVVGVMMLALLTTTVGSATVLLLQGAYASGRSWDVVLNYTLINDVLSTRLGAAVLLRLFLSLAWMGLVVAAARGLASSRTWMNVCVVVSFLTVATFSVSGHASGASWPAVFMVVDAVHLTALAVWVGALVPLATVARSSDPAVTEAARRFSRRAARAMPVAVVAGALLGLHLSGGLQHVLDTTYGRLLLAKICLTAVVVVVGLAARRKLVGDAPRIAAIVRIEAVVAVAVLVVTSFLVGAAPGPVRGWAQSFGASLVQGDVMVNVTVQPAAVGTSEIHALFDPPGGMLEPVKDVSMSMSLPEADIPAIPVKLIELGPNHWSGVAQIPYAGEWTMEIRCSPKTNETILFSKTFTVAES